MLQNKRIAEKGGSCKNHQPHISTADALAKPSPVVDEKKERQKPNNESISCTMLMINNNEAWRNKRGEKISNLLSLKNHLQIRFGLAFALESGEGEGINKTRETVPKLGHHAVVNLARR
jgi:hypothetical protein